MPTVMLRRDWPAHFRRSIRDLSNQVIAVVELSPGTPQEVDLDTLSGLQADIEKKTIILISETETVPGSILRDVDTIPPSDAVAVADGHIEPPSSMERKTHRRR